MASNVEISKRAVLLNTAATIAGQLLAASVFIWLQQYLVRRIAAEEYSLLPVLGAVMVFIPLLSTILGGGIARYVVEAYAEGDERRVTQITSTMFPFLLGFAVFLLAGGGVFAWHVARVLTIAPDRVGDARFMMTLMVFTSAVRVAAAPFLVGLYARQKFVLQNGIELASQGVFLVVLFVLLAVGGTRVRWVVVANTAMNLCNTLVLLWVSRRCLPPLRWRISEFRWHLVKPLTRFGGWLSLSQLSWMLRMAGAPLVLNKMSSAAQVTSFHLGSLADRQIQPFMMNATMPLQPVLIAMHAAGEKERLAYTYMRMGRLALWVTLGAAVPLTVFGREFYQLYLRHKYASYSTAPVVMGLLLAYYPVLYATNGLMRAATAVAKMRGMVLVDIAGQIASLALMAYLSGWLGLGAIGAALSILVTGLVTSLCGFWPIGLQMLGLDFRAFARETLWPGLSPALAAVFACTALRALVRPSGWAEWVACCAVGLMVHVAALLAFSLRPADRNDLRRILARIGLFRSES